MREQLEGQISRLQQENSILRDAVSSATNQMESKSVLHSCSRSLEFHTSLMLSVVKHSDSSYLS